MSPSLQDFLEGYSPELTHLFVVIGMPNWHPDHNTKVTQINSTSRVNLSNYYLLQPHDRNTIKELITLILPVLRDRV